MTVPLVVKALCLSIQRIMKPVQLSSRAEKPTQCDWRLVVRRRSYIVYTEQAWVRNTTEILPAHKQEEKSNLCSFSVASININENYSHLLVVRGVAAISVQHIHKIPCNNTIHLLRRMKFVIPHERIRTISQGTVLGDNIAMMLKPCDICWC